MITKPTDLEAESAEQSRWHFKADAPFVSLARELSERLLHNEFLNPAKLLERRRQRLQNLLQFASTQVPYYTKIFRELNLGVEAFNTPDSLHPLPALTKTLLREKYDDLLGQNLPEGQEVTHISRTSGTTGQPVKVLQSRMSMIFFGLLKQREYRWFRFDPSKTIAYVRPPDEFPHDRFDSETKTYHAEKWPYVGRWWKTGEAIGCDHTEPVDDQVAWLGRMNPYYLVTESGDLECLTLGHQGISIPKNLSGIQAVSHQLTSGMRKRAESAFHFEIDQNYGLNEIGIVATRCPEAGRYHYHQEHCLVEIVDDEGRACKEGETGCMLVTALNNWAMPLIRYDTDDMAEVVSGPCPCGRALPSFGRIVGRYRRIAYLPEGTWRYWQVFRVEIEAMPEKLSLPLRQYQLHQNSDHSFEFRFISVTDPDSEFYDYLNAAWSKATEGNDAVKFNIQRMDEIPRGTGHKLQNFTSDFSPPMEEENEASSSQ